MGESALQGPHQVAVKSTRTGTPAPSTSVSKLRSLNTWILSDAMGLSRVPYNIMPPEHQATPARGPTTLEHDGGSAGAHAPSSLLTPGRPSLPPGWTPDGVISTLEALSEERR